MNFLISIFLGWFVLSFLVIPNIHTIYSAFFYEGAFTLEPFQRLTSSERAMNSLRNSFILGPVLTVTVGIVGLSLVFLTEYFDIKGAKILRLGYMTTLIYSGIILVSGYMFLYGHNGYITNIIASIFPYFNTRWFQGFWAVLFVMTFACTSNHLLFLRTAMQSVDYQTIEAARNMGASQWTILRKVVLPVLTPSLMAVSILTFLVGLNATSAPLLVGGADFQTITPMILTFARSRGSRDLATILALLLGVASLVLLTFLTRIEKKGNYLSVSKVKTTMVKQKIVHPIANLLAHIYAYALFVIYTAPVVLIVLFSFTNSATIAQRRLSFASFTLENYMNLFRSANAYRPFLNSIIFSGLSAIGVAIFVIFACRWIQKYNNRLTEILEYLMMIPWLLPSTLIALGLVTTFSNSHWFMFNRILTGTSIIMLIAYMLVNMPFTTRMTKAAFFSLDPALEDAAKNLGASPFYTFIKIVLPTILPTVLAILALNFNAMLGDFDVSVFLYHPLNLPLGVHVRTLSDGQANADNAAVSLVYAVFMMVISATVLYLVYGRKAKKT